MSSYAQTGRKARRARQAQEKSRKLAIGAGVALVVVVFIAWLTWSTLGGSSQATVQRVDVEGSDVGKIAPNFTVPTLDNSTFTLADQRGKPTVVFFMAYWCGTCMPEARALARLSMEYGDRAHIIAIDVDPSSTPASLQQFKRAAGDGIYTWAFDAQQQVTQRYQVSALETTLIIDADGYIVYRGASPSYGTLNREIKKFTTS